MVLGGGVARWGASGGRRASGEGVVFVVGVLVVMVVLVVGERAGVRKIFRLRDVK